MAYFETNNDFFGYTGTINRKNYAINMLILLTIFFGLSFINFSVFARYTAFKFLFSILSFVVSMVRFVAVFAMLSLVYRRLTDIAKSKTYRFADNAKKFFVIFFVLPVLYFFVKVFLVNIPFISYILDWALLFVIAPLALLSALIISFIK